jgi:hypothetical protein
VLGHILNITNGFIDGIILMVTLLAILSCHYIVCLFESHSNFVSNGICKNLHVIVLFGFFYSFYSDWDFLDIYQRHISIGA